MKNLPYTVPACISFTIITIFVIANVGMLGHACPLYRTPRAFPSAARGCHAAKLPRSLCLV